MRYRSGIGYDVHSFAQGRRCVIGGVDIPHEVGLQGHSDADVLCHAIADAVLGAVGERDIGHHFPVNDPGCRDMSSLVILQRVAAIVESRNARIENIDSTVIAEAPRIGPHLDAMKAKMSEALRIEPERIGVKATTNEGMGFIGRAEGVAALASASVAFPE
jgi:2-C-methyl-D-erythritol 2,4-cyclodiphosphate synthase